MRTCATCASVGIDHESVVKECLRSPWAVGRFLCKFDKLDPFLHGALADWFVQGINDGCRRFAIITPRDHLKTTLFGISLLVWRYINNQEERMLYVMATSDNAEEKLSVVKSVITDPGGPFAHFFPQLLVDPSGLEKWRNDAIQVPRVGEYPDPTVKAVGITSNLVGGHYTWQIFDDLIDERRAESLVDQQKAINFVRRSGPLFVDRKKDVRLIIGTYWPGPFYKWLLEEAEFMKLYKTVILGCFVDDRFINFLQECGRELPPGVAIGDPIWPKQFTKASLEEELLEAGEYDFSHQWLNIPLSESMKRFQEEDFVPYKSEDIDPFAPYMLRIMTVDPSTGEGRDKSAIIVSAFDRRDGKVYILEAWDGMVLPSGLIEQIFRTVKRWSPHLVRPEDTAFQNTLKHFMREEMKRRGIGFFIKPVKPGGISKKVRIIDGLQPFVKHGKIHVTNAHRNLVKELVGLRVIGGKLIGESPNLADALAYQVEDWLGASPQRRKEVEFVDQLKERNRRNQNAAYGLECET